MKPVMFPGEEGIGPVRLLLLYVSYNQLSGPLPAGLGTNSSLTFLDLRTNMLTGDMSILDSLN